MVPDSSQQVPMPIEAVKNETCISNRLTGDPEKDKKIKSLLKVDHFKNSCYIFFSSSWFQCNYCINFFCRNWTKLKSLKEIKQLENH